MGEFKGTKGKLEVKHDTDFGSYNVVNKSLGEKYYVAQCSYIPDARFDQAEAKANAQLISKAPEMLAMLHTYLDDLNNIAPYSDARNNRINQVRELIKEATEVDNEKR